MVSEHSEQEFQKTMKGANKELDAATARFNNFDSVIQQLYEDKLEGLFNEERFNKLFLKYETEQKGLKVKINELHTFIETEKEKYLNAYYLIKLVRKYTEINELADEIIQEFINKIVCYTS